MSEPIRKAVTKVPSDGWDGRPAPVAGGPGSGPGHLTDAQAEFRRLANNAPAQNHDLPTVQSSLRLAPGGDAVETLQRRAEARYRALVEQIPAITFMASLDGGAQELYVSPQIESMLGFTQREWLENPVLWFNQLHPEDHGRWQDEFARTVFGGESFRSEYRFIARNGNVVWVRGEAKMVRDAGGRPLFLHGVAFDITEQKEAEQLLRRGREQLEEEVQRRTADLNNVNRVLQAEIAERQRVEENLRDREGRLRAIIEGAADGIVMLDDGGKIESFNPGAERIFGYPAAEVLGTSVGRLMPSFSQEPGEGGLDWSAPSDAERKQGIRRDVVGRRKDGSTFPIDLALSETSAGKGRRFTGIIRDITERKLVEAELLKAKTAAETANRLKSEFLANMSHEIRTPMNGVLGVTSLVLKTELTADQQELLETVKSSADGLLAILNDILDFSKIEAGQLHLEAIEFNLLDCLRDATRILAFRAQQQGVSLSVNVGADAPELVIGDPGRLRQVLLNLIGNALKFTRQGTVTLAVEREPGSDDPGRMRFAVTDTGIGIPPEKQALIFDPFRQADSSTSRKFGGTGLGLAIASQLVSRMGGRLAVQSQVGQGSTFSFGADFKLPKNPPRPFAELPTPTSFVGPPRPLRILLAEDNPVNQLVARRLLEKLGHGVTVARNGREAVAAVCADRFDLVLMDVEMPEMDGFEATAAIRAWEGRASRLPIVAVTAHAMKGDRERCLESGMDAYVSKPLDFNELLQVVARLIPSSRRSSSRLSVQYPASFQQDRQRR